MLLLGDLVALDCGHRVVRRVSLPYHVGGGRGGQVREVGALVVGGTGGGGHRGGVVGGQSSRCVCDILRRLARGGGL